MDCTSKTPTLRSTSQACFGELTRPWKGFLLASVTVESNRLIVAPAAGASPNAVPATATARTIVIDDFSRTMRLPPWSTGQS